MTLIALQMYARQLEDGFADGRVGFETLRAGRAHRRIMVLVTIARLVQLILLRAGTTPSIESFLATDLGQGRQNRRRSSLRVRQPCTLVKNDRSSMLGRPRLS